MTYGPVIISSSTPMMKTIIAELEERRGPSITRYKTSAPLFHMFSFPADGGLPASDGRTGKVVKQSARKRNNGCISFVVMEIGKVYDGSGNEQPSLAISDAPITFPASILQRFTAWFAGKIRFTPLHCSCCGHAYTHEVGLNTYKKRLNGVRTFLNCRENGRTDHLFILSMISFHENRLSRFNGMVFSMP